ncbi:MAG: hypothetical protein JRI23_18855 [Deltaproteobacteria bacterium]|nr:hypothetical protein [Deltaproteobacteria bacterium]
MMAGVSGCGSDEEPGPGAAGAGGTVTGAAGGNGAGGLSSAGGGGAGGAGAPTVTLAVRKGFPDLWGEGADNIRGGSAAGSVKFFVTSVADTDEATFVPATGSAEAHYEGTLRGALLLEEPRHIIPRVSGNVDLASAISVSGATRGSFTYHGHLAPEGGLYVTNDNLVITGLDDFILRHLRLRFGSASTLSVDDVLSIGRANQVAVDHCSLAWGADETFTVQTAVESTYVDIIAQNNILGQCRDGHNTGTLIGWTDEGDNAHGEVSWHNNVYVGVTHRTPNFAGDTEMYGRVFNNVAYDWQHRLTNVVGAPTIDVAYNYYKMGPANPTVPASNYNQYQDLQGSRPYPPSIFTEGNIMPSVLTDESADNEVLWSYFGSSDPLPAALFRATRLPIDGTVGYEPTTAQAAYERNVVAKEAGANRATDESGNPVIGLDSVDDAYLTAIANGTDPRTAEASWLHPTVASHDAYPDANWNGIADPFETAHGIDAADEVIPVWDFGDYVVVNDAGYDAFEIYSAWVAGDFERIVP